MPRLRKICDETGVLLIADEVMSGWGRSPENGSPWSTGESSPDILVTAKGITSAYVPLGLCATTAKRSVTTSRTTTSRTATRTKHTP